MSGARVHAEASGQVDDAVRGSSTGAPAPARQIADASSDSTSMFGDIAPHVRLQLELVARTSASPELALEPIIALLVEDDEAKRAAIVSAISTNEPLREQWERTWQVLRR